MNWKFWHKPQLSLQQEVEQDASDLERDILARELDLISVQHRIAGDRARQRHLIEWLQRKNGASSLEASLTEYAKRG